MIPLFSNTLGEDEWFAVRDVLRSRWLGMGPECAALENELAAHFGVDRVLLTSCATAGLYLALRAQGMPPGAEVIIPSIHFVAAASAIFECGGVPVYADVDQHTLNITVDEIARRVTERTWGVSLLHYGGHPCDMGPILDVCGVNGLVVIEDAANAVASTWCGRACGTLGDAGVWSFDSMKVMVMGDGGALWLHDDAAHKLAWHLRNCGLDATSGTDNVGKKNRWWEFTVVEPSGRSDSNDLLATIGRVQLRKLAGFVARRREVWDTYQRELAGVGDVVLPPEPLSGCTGTYYLFWIQTARRDRLARWLVDHGVYCTFRYHPLHVAFRANVRLPVAEQVSEVTLCIPIHQNLTDDDTGKIVDAIKEFYRR